MNDTDTKEKTAVRRPTRKPHCSTGLSVRVLNLLNVCNLKSREEIMEAYQSGRLKPNKRPYMYGWKAHKEIAKWLGLPEPHEPQKQARRIYVQETCPHCGGKLV